MKIPSYLLSMQWCFFQTNPLLFTSSFLQNIKTMDILHSYTSFTLVFKHVTIGVSQSFTVNVIILAARSTRYLLIIMVSLIRQWILAVPYCFLKLYLIIQVIKQNGVHTSAPVRHCKYARTIIIDPLWSISTIRSILVHLVYFDPFQSTSVYCNPIWSIQSIKVHFGPLSPLRSIQSIKP